MTSALPYNVRFRFVARLMLGQIGFIAMYMRANFVYAFHLLQKQLDPTSVKPLRKSKSIKSEALSRGCI